MTQHQRAPSDNQHPHTIALCLLFVGLSLLGAQLSLWQWARGEEKVLLQQQRQQVVQWQPLTQEFTIFIEKADRHIERYHLAQLENLGSIVAIEESLWDERDNSGYWHPIEQNIFQTEEVQELSQSCCQAYNLWSCQKTIENFRLEGVVRKSPWVPSMTPERHQAYAWQWAGLSLAALGMAFALGRNLILSLTHVFFNTRSTS